MGAQASGAEEATSKRHTARVQCLQEDVMCPLKEPQDGLSTPDRQSLRAMASLMTTPLTQLPINSSQAERPASISLHTG